MVRKDFCLCDSTFCVCFADGFGGGEAFEDAEDKVEEGGGWDVDDEDLDLPPGLVSISSLLIMKMIVEHTFCSPFISHIMLVVCNLECTRT